MSDSSRPVPSPLQWAFWPLWVLANALGGAIGIALSSMITQWSSASQWSLACGFLFVPTLLIWVPLGLAQGTVLSLYLGRVIIPWALSSIIGGFLAVAIAFQLAMGLTSMEVPYDVTLAIVAGIGGLAVGFCQTYVLDDRVSAPWWWLLASPVSWAAALFVEGYARWHGIGFALLGQSNIAHGAATITIAAAISGAALAWMLVYRPLKPLPQKTEAALITGLDDGTSLALQQPVEEGR